jgi:phage shock protein PspC (stress-responsive transcriptional regulator)
MKWKLKRIADRFFLFLVSIKPIRWFFDQLVALSDWAIEVPYLSTIWKWHSKLAKPFWIVFTSCWALYDVWLHDWVGVGINIFYIIVWLIMPNKDNPRNNDNDEEPDDPDPTPNGDAVDMWIREQQKVTMK